MTLDAHATGLAVTRDASEARSFEADEASEQPPSRRLLVTLCALGAGLLAIYAASSWRMPLYEWFPGPTAEGLDFVKISGDWRESTREYLGVVVGTFALYVPAVVLAWRTRARIPLWLLFGFPALFALALVPMYPTNAIDMFHYHGASRVLWIHGQNPLTVAPGEFPYPIWFYWNWQPSPYGPAWSLLGGIVTWPAGEHALIALHGFKVLAAGSVLGCAYLIWRIAGRIWPGSASLAVVVFAWNPFVLYRVVGNGHNDLVMMLFVLLAFRAFEERRWMPGMVALTLSVLIKFVTVLLGPLFLLYLWQHSGPSVRERARTVLGAGALCLAVALAIYAPFWDGMRTFETLRGQANHMITSTAVALAVWHTGFPDDPDLQHQIIRVLRVIFLALAAVLWWVGRRDLPRMIVASFSVMMLYILLATGWFRPWYLLWPITLAALAPRSWLTVVLIATTFFGLLPDIVEQYRDVWDFLGEDYTVLSLAPILVIWVPIIVSWVLGMWRFDHWALDVLRRPRGRAQPVAAVAHDEATPGA